MMSAKRTVGLFALLVTLSGFIFGSQVQAADPRNGAMIYSKHCSSCHGPRGKGAMPGMPDFTRPQSLAVADDKLVHVLETGSGMMPSYRGLLTTQDMLDVISHIRTFQ